MTGLAALASERADLLDAFTERACARAYLWSIGEYELHEAVDKLEADARRDGLSKRIGVDGVQRILADAFGPYRRAEMPPEAGEEGALIRHTLAADQKSSKRLTPQTTIEAIMWCVRERGPQVLREPENIERLSRCDEAAISEIARRIPKLEPANAS